MAQLYVHGDSLQVIQQQTDSPTLVVIVKWNESLFFCTFQSFLVGIIVPDPEVMPEWAKKKGIEGSFKDMCKNLVGS